MIRRHRIEFLSEDARCLLRRANDANALKEVLPSPETKERLLAEFGRRRDNPAAPLERRRGEGAALSMPRLLAEPSAHRERSTPLRSARARLMKWSLAAVMATASVWAVAGQPELRSALGVDWVLSPWFDTGSARSEREPRARKPDHVGLEPKPELPSEAPSLPAESIVPALDTAALDTAALDTAALDTAALDTAALDTNQAATPSAALGAPPRERGARAPAAATPAPFPSQTPGLDPELRLITAGRAALDRGAHDAALDATREHARRFPAGMLSHERLAIEAIASCAGHGETALGRRFVERWPSSLFTPRVARACGLRTISVPRDGAPRTQD